jgi:F0F1-type ATP synthase delta subunit
MTIAASYARALYELVATDPGKSAAYLKNLRTSVTRRGHIKLLPKILSEYQKLDIGQERSTRYTAVTPEKERVRVLLGLYKKLIEAK